MTLTPSSPYRHNTVRVTETYDAVNTQRNKCLVSTWECHIYLSFVPQPALKRSLVYCSYLFIYFFAANHVKFRISTMHPAALFKA